VFRTKPTLFIYFLANIINLNTCLFRQFPPFPFQLELLTTPAITYCLLHISFKLALNPTSTNTFLEQVSNIGRHLLNLSVVELLNVLHVAHICSNDEVDTHALAAEAS